MIEESVLKVVQNLASKSPYREICGLISSDNKVYPVTNIAVGSSSFIMSKPEYFRALSEIKLRGATLTAIYHSHPVDPTPSEADLEFVRRVKLDSLIVTPTEYRYIDAKKYI